MLVYQRVVSQFLCHVRLPKSKAYPPSDIDPSCIMSWGLEDYLQRGMRGDPGVGRMNPPTKGDERCRLNHCTGKQTPTRLALIMDKSTTCWLIPVSGFNPSLTLICGVLCGVYPPVIRLITHLLSGMSDHVLSWHRVATQSLGPAHSGWRSYWRCSQMQRRSRSDFQRSVTRTRGQFTIKNANGDWDFNNWIDNWLGIQDSSIYLGFDSFQIGGFGSCFALLKSGLARRETWAPLNHKDPTGILVPSHRKIGWVQHCSTTRLGWYQCDWYICPMKGYVYIYNSLGVSGGKETMHGDRSGWKSRWLLRSTTCQFELDWRLHGQSWIRKKKKRRSLV